MSYSLPSINFTIDFVKEAHKNQKRKYSDDDYYVHCLNVANIVSGISDDVEVIYSALLHDIIEDTAIRFTDIKNIFNQSVAIMVNELTTFKDKSIPRKVRKEIDREMIKHTDYRVQTIKLADMIDNLKDLKEQDEKFAKTYFAEKKLMLNCLTKGDGRLWDRCKKIIDRYYEQE